MKIVIDIPEEDYNNIEPYLNGETIKGGFNFFKALEIIKNGKPLQNKWIPVSEKLPKVGREVLVCYDFKGARSVYIANFYGDGKFHGMDDEYLTPEGRKYRKAVAWMPLPKPYKAESEDV